jgi:hypothetical protein
MGLDRDAGLLLKARQQRMKALFRLPAASSVREGVIRTIAI